MARIVFGISGASGWQFGKAILKWLAGCKDLEIHLLVSQAATQVAREECGEDFSSLAGLAHSIYEINDFGAPMASGSWLYQGMIVCPCSLNTLGSVAGGLSGNLLQRAAAVALKERRPLILCVRETPYTSITLFNMTTAASAGATIMPFSPVFYSGLRMDDAIRQFAGHLLDILHIPNHLRIRWKDDQSLLA